MLSIASLGSLLLPSSGKGYRLHDNVFYPGTTSAAFSVADPATFESDHNLVWRPGFIRAPLVAYARNWPGDFAAYRRLTDQDAHSLTGAAARPTSWSCDCARAVRGTAWAQGSTWRPTGAGMWMVTASLTSAGRTSYGQCLP